MTAEVVGRRARRFVLVGACFLVLALGAMAGGLPHRSVVILTLLGFVLHTVFGKAYSLVPTYFDSEVAWPGALAIQLPLTAGGTGLLAIDASSLLPVSLDTVGALCWSGGVVVFLGTLGWTIHDNLSGRRTATGEANAERAPVDRLANLFVPLALAYLAVGTYALLAASAPVFPPLVDGYPPRATHLLAAGTASLLLFAIGFRLLPRFLVASPPRPLVALVLVAGALGPALLATGLPAGPLLHAGAALQALAVLGYALAIVVLLSRSPRQRVGFYGVFAGAVFGILGVSIGVLMAVDGATAAALLAHARLNLFGFLGLTIVGVSYQFYPPAVGSFRGASDRTAVVAMGFIASGILVSAAGVLSGVDPLATAGAVIALLGGLLHSALLVGLFAERYGGR